MEQQVYLRVGQVAALLGVNSRTVRRWLTWRQQHPSQKRPKMTANLRSLLYTLAKLLALPWRLATYQPSPTGRYVGEVVWARPRRRRE